MGQSCGRDHRNLHDAGHPAVLLPCRLVDDLVHALLLYGIGVAATRGKDAADNRTRPLGMAIVEVLPNQVAMLLVSLARLVVHIHNDAIGVTHCHGTVHAFCPFIVFHFVLRFVLSVVGHKHTAPHLNATFAASRCSAPPPTAKLQNPSETKAAYGNKITTYAVEFRVLF